MIYTVICESQKFDISELEKRDCRDMRQPLNLIDQSVLEFVEKTGNINLKRDRFAAYATLFFCVKYFFGIESFSIKRSDAGKPYAIDQFGSPLPFSFNISHSDGIVAVTLSDEGEVGVDVQSCFDNRNKEKIMKRPFMDFEFPDSRFNTEVFLFDPVENYIESYATPSYPKDDLYSRWVLIESTLKCMGEGFSGLPHFKDYLNNIKYFIFKANFDSKTYLVSVALKRINA